MFFDTSYPTFTDMYGLLDRADVILSGLYIAKAIQSPMYQDEATSFDPIMKTLVFVNCWFHGSVQDRRKVIEWLRTSEIPIADPQNGLFVLCSMAYGIAAAHLELGSISKSKIDLIVANIMGLSLHFSELHHDKIPRNFKEVAKYLSQCKKAKLCDLESYLLRLTNFPGLRISVKARVVLSYSRKLALNCIRRLPIIDYDEGAILRSKYPIILLKNIQPLLSRFHEQCCPWALRFDGFMTGLCADENMSQLNTKVRYQIFGNDRQKQESLLDSFLPEGMTREQAGFPPRSFWESLIDQRNCSMIRKKILGDPSLFEKVPQHLAIIMDGNRRYAKERNFENVVMGYTLGARQLMQIFPWCYSVGIKCVTLWAMSSDNFKRDPEEVNGLIRMMTAFFEDFLLLDGSVAVMGVRVRITGDRSILPESLNKAITEVERATETHNGFNLQIAINYGGREEIVAAVREAIQESPEKEITIQDISNRTYSAKFGLPEVDAIFRTSGECRTSGYHLWETLNAELIFAKPKWPELTELQFLEVALQLATRQRRHGR
jgi:undecaprenyl diphosphate synthase